MKTRLLIAAAVAAAVGCTPAEPPDGASGPRSASTATRSGLAASVAQLPVAPERATGYDREQFGDYDRDAILERNLAAFGGCDGYMSRYDGQCYALVEHGGNPERADDDLDIDHRVALGEAWASGAYDWPATRRDDFASDPANLIVMTATMNRSKGQQDPAEWMPPEAECHYAQRYVDTKLAYGLAADREEKQALQDLAARC